MVDKNLIKSYTNLTETTLRLIEVAGKLCCHAEHYKNKDFETAYGNILNALLTYNKTNNSKEK